MSTEAQRLGVLDTILLVASCLVSALIGLYFTNKNNSIDSLLLGDKRMSTIPVAISLMTSCLSAISLLGSSAEFYYHGTSYSFIAIAMLICGPIIAITTLPVFYRLQGLSLYRYLQLRYGLLVKYIVNTVFIVQLTFVNGVVLYVPGMALESILGIERFYSILLMGLMCIAYSAIGGLKAVVWTDFFQAISMYAGLIVVCVLGTYDAGGFGNVYQLALENGRLDLYGLFNLDFTTRHTLLGFLLGSTIGHVYFVGVNQIQVQRALSLPSLRQSQLAFVLCSIFGAIMLLFSSYMGAVLVAAYRSCDPYLAGQIPRRDAIIVHYVANRLAHIPGLRGVFVAGIFSATLSTLSSFANSMAALALEDYIKPILRLSGYRHSLDDRSSRSATCLAKVLTMIFGLICVLMAYLVEKANSRLLQAVTTLFGAYGVPFLGCFMLGIFTRFANTPGILAGFLVTLTLGTYIVAVQTFFQPALEPKMPVFYDHRCESVFNMTLPPSSLPSVFDIFFWDHNLGFPPVTRLPFKVVDISYLMFSFVQFVLMIVVGSLVSLLTGGWRQQVADELVVEFLWETKPEQKLQTNCQDYNQSTSQGKIKVLLEEMKGRQCTNDQQLRSKNPEQVLEDEKF